jgi:hypothetical protein
VCPDLNAWQSRVHRVFIYVVRLFLNARQIVAFAVRPIENAWQRIWRMTMTVFPVVNIITKMHVLFAKKGKALLSIS